MPPGDNMSNFKGTEAEVRIIAQDEIDKKHSEHEKMNDAQIEASTKKAVDPIYDRLNLLDHNLTKFSAGITQSIKTNQKWTMALIAIGAVIASLISGKI